MALLVSAVITEAAILLNDTAQTLYTNTILLPFFNRAYRELENKLRLAGYPYAKKVATVSVTALATTYPSPPADLYQPVALYERPSGGTEADYVLMEERSWEPLETQTSELRYWMWRQLLINFLGSTATREVKLQYLSVFPTITLTTETVQVIDAQSCLASKTAAIAAEIIMKDMTRASVLEAAYESQKEDIIGMLVKKNQSLPARPFGYRTRRTTF